MCSVQVLAGVDFMRYENLRRNMLVARRPGNPRDPCRRLLFREQPEPAAAPGPDPQAAVQRLQEEMSERAARRWNFDFLRERPLPGRYQWVPVGAAAAAAGPPPVAEVAQPEEAEKEAPQSKQSKITDYMSHRKRRSSTSVSSPKLKTRRSNPGNPSCNTTTTSTSSTSSTDSSSVTSS